MHSRTTKTKPIGSILVETLIAILIAMMLTTVLVSMFSQVKRASNAMHAELLVTAISQELIDQLRAMPFDYVFANKGTHTVQVNGVGCNDALFPRPLLQDESLFDYTVGGNPIVEKKLANSLHTINVDSDQIDDTAEVRILPQGNGSLRIEVTIIYVDGTGKRRKHYIKTIMTQNGITG